MNLSGVVKSRLPRRARGLAYRALVAYRANPSARRMLRWLHRGTARCCPICDSRVRAFRPFGVRARPDARCPVCGSLERHRLYWRYLHERTTLFQEPRKKLLHVAPEPALAQRYASCPAIEYLSADLDSPLAMLRMDLTDIPFPDDTFDVIICSHVLEHVSDDARAMRELWRVLRRGGWSLLQVPIGAETTIEDPRVQTPEERERVFKQRDHVRVYGRDYRDRLERAGFAVIVEDYVAQLPAEEARRMGLRRGEASYRCEKPLSPERAFARS